MSACASLEPQFVEFLPEKLDEGVLYISIPYATTAHLCACGCREEVVAPLSPTDWRLTFDGETVSLEPSIGNWSFACQSHYWIEGNRVDWAPRWSKEKIARGREHDRLRKRGHSGERDERLTDKVSPASTKLRLLKRIRLSLVRRARV
ncbi:MAG: DUF6527 family protein [Candidatus Binataceae bacterium]